MSLLSGEHIIEVPMTEETRAAMNKIFEEVITADGEWRAYPDYISIYVPRTDIPEVLLPLIKTINLRDIKSKAVLLSARVEPEFGCNFCKDMEGCKKLKLCQCSYQYSEQGYDVQFKDIRNAKFCPVCGRRLPESED